jgi:hypothetical protein
MRLSFAYLCGTFAIPVLSFAVLRDAPEDVKVVNRMAVSAGFPERNVIRDNLVCADYNKIGFNLGQVPLAVSVNSHFISSLDLLYLMSQGKRLI